MDEITHKKIEEIEAYSGPHAIEGIRFRHAREALGISAWGMNVLELDAHCSAYPEHDHTKDGHEEVYVVLRGSVILEHDGKRTALSQGDLVRVPAPLKRKLVTEDEGATVLALGGTPGEAYTSSMGG